jgi:transcriptional regulator with XRE-family HTH domain
MIGGCTVPAGQKLKTLRNRRNITVREVEQASRRIADAKGDKRFCISNGWLAQLENGVSEPSICKLFSLSVIYHANFLDLVGLYNVDVDDKEKYEPVANPYLTQLLSHKTDGGGNLLSISNPNEILMTSLAHGGEEMHPQPNGNGNHAPQLIHGYLGLTDFTMYPMIRPGASLKIDTNQNKLAAVAWRSEYERPIFFIELHDAYACGWCELQANQLLIIPHHSSPASVRRFIYPREAEIVGRVVGYSTPCVDLESHLAELRKMKRMAHA